MAADASDTQLDMEWVVGLVDTHAPKRRERRGTVHARDWALVERT